MARVCWLHLSDLHYHDGSEVESYNRQVVLQELLADIRDRVARVGPEVAKLDFVVFTGDLAHSGKEEEYALAEQHFVAPLLAALTRPDGYRPPFFMVPGNHDADRSRIPVIGGPVDEGTGTRDDINTCLLTMQHHERLLARNGPFFEATHRICPHIRLQRPAFHYANRLDCDGAIVGVVGLNSSWLAKGGPDDRTRLAIGEAQVRQALEPVRDCQLIVALFHHPFEWLLDAERDSTQQLIERTCHFILTGHLHRQRVGVIISPRFSVATVPAGAIYGSRDVVNSYNYVSVDIASGEVAVFFRSWNSDGSEWRQDWIVTPEEAGGVYRFRHPALTPHSTPPLVESRFDGGELGDRGNALRGLPETDTITESSGGVPSVSGILLVGEPPQAPRLIGRESDIEALSAMVHDHGVSCLWGMPGIGKSALAAALSESAQAQKADDLGPNNVLWLQCTSQTGINDAAAAALCELRRSPPQVDIRSVPGLVSQLVKELRQRRVLMIVDQAERLMRPSRGPGQVEDFQTLLDGLRADLGASRVLFISTEPMADRHGVLLPNHRLHGLGIRSSVQFLRERGITAPESILAEVARRCLGHPVVLIIASQLATDEASAVGLVTNRQRWQGSLQQIASRLFDEVYRLHLSETERAILTGLSVLRQPANLPALAFVSGLNDAAPREAPATVAQLVARGLIAESGGFLHIHPMLAIVCYDRATGVEQLHRRAAGLLMMFAEGAKSVYTVAPWYYLQACEHAERAGDLATAVFLLWRAAWYLQQQGHHDVVLLVSERLLARTHQGSTLDPASSVGLCITAGKSYNYFDRADHALALYERTWASTQSAATSGNLAALTVGMGASLLVLHRYAEALSWSDKAIDLARRASDPMSESAGLGNKGIALRRLKRASEAEVWLQRALEIQRRIGDADGQVTQLTALAHLKLEAELLGSAQRLFGEAIDIATTKKLTVQKMRCLVYLAEVLRRRGMLVQAIECLKESLRLSRHVAPSWVPREALLLMATLWVEAHRIQAAVGCCLVAQRLAPFDRSSNPKQDLTPEKLLEILRLHIPHETFAQAERDIVPRLFEWLDELLAEPRPHFSVGAVDGQGKPIQLFKTYDGPDFWNDFAAALLLDDARPDRFSEAEKLLRAAVDEQPDTMYAHLNLAQTLIAIGKTDEAVFETLQAEKLCPDDPDIWQVRARAEMLADHWQAALGYLRRVQTSRPESRDSLELLGICLDCLELWPESFAVWSQLVEMCPGEKRYEAKRAFSMSRIGRGDQAMIVFEQLLADDPTNESLLLERALVMSAWGDHDVAVAEMDRLIASSTAPHVLMHWRAIALHEAGRLEDAERAWRELMSACPEDAVACYNLGVLLRALRRDDEAAHLFRRSIDLKTAFWKPYCNLADLLHRRGAYSEALYYCEAGLLRNPDAKELRETLREIQQSLSTQQADRDAQPPRPHASSRRDTKKRASRRGKHGKRHGRHH